MFLTNIIYSVAFAIVRLLRISPVFSILTLAFLLTACSGDENGDANLFTAVERVEIQQSGLILTDLGESRQLSATAYDFVGNAVDVPITWSSTKPLEVSVDDDGTVTAENSHGASQIVAEADGVQSAPLLVVVTTPAPNAVLLNDEQIVGDPIESDPDAEPGFDNTYRVVLSGVEAPGIGTTLINTGSKPVAGEVVEVDVTGDQIVVTLKILSVTELFPDLEIDEQIDLSNAPVQLNPALAAAYDVVQDGNTYIFTPKLTPQGVTLSTALAPFECEGEVTGPDLLPFRLSALPILSVDHDFSLDVRYVRSVGLERFVLTGEVKPKIQVGVEVSAAFEGSVECAAELFTIRVPIGGPLSLLVGGLVDVETVFAIGGKVTLASAELGGKAEVTARAKIGFACSDGTNCTFVREVEGDSDVVPIWTVDLGVPRFEPELSMFGRIKLAIGNPFLKSLHLEAVKASAGPTLSGSFALVGSQIADSDYKSEYDAKLKTQAAAARNLGDALRRLGVKDINMVELNGSIQIGRSPTGSVTADRASFVPGDTVTFNIRLDPGTVNFIPAVGPYNASSILLVRSVVGGTFPVEIDRVTATPGQTDFSITFTASDTGLVSEFTAFVITELLPMESFSLELASAMATIDQRIAFHGTAMGANRIYVMNASGGGITALSPYSTDPDHPYAYFSAFSPAWSPDGTKIAFESGGQYSDIYVMNANGGSIVRLTDTSSNPSDSSPGSAHSPAWSPDGTKIAFHGTTMGANRIYVMNASGGGITALSPYSTDLDHPYAYFSAFSPAWSLDGTKIAFEGGGQYSDIYVMNANGGSIVRLTDTSSNPSDSSPGSAHSPAWSPAH